MPSLLVASITVEPCGTSTSLPSISTFSIYAAFDMDGVCAPALPHFGSMSFPT